MNENNNKKLIWEFQQLAKNLCFDLTEQNINDLLQNWNRIYDSFLSVRKIDVSNVPITNLLPQLENHNLKIIEKIIPENLAEHNLQTVCLKEKNLIKVK